MRPILGFLLSGALVLVLTGVASAQQQQPQQQQKQQSDPSTPVATPSTPSAGVSATGNTTNNAGAEGTVTTPNQAGAQGQVESSTSAGVDAKADADKKLDRVRQRAKKASEKARAALEKRLDVISKEIDAEANTSTDAVVAGRVGPEFGVTADILMAEQASLKAGLGELVIAHTLVANTKGMTVEQLFTLHREGLGWGQIAHGLNLRLGEVNVAVRSEGNVALGKAQADGKVAPIQSAARVDAGAKASVNTPAAGAKVGTASKVGVDVNVGK